MYNFTLLIYCREDFTTLYSATYGKCYMFNYIGEEEAMLSKKPKIVKSPGRNHGKNKKIQIN